MSTIIQPLRDIDNDVYYKDNDIVEIRIVRITPICIRSVAMTETITLVQSTDVRESETAATRAYTLASPTVGGSTRTSLWRVKMFAGATGPRHLIDSEQIWTVVSGDASIRTETGEIVARAGDTVIMPGGVLRTVIAVTDCEFLVCGSPNALATVPGSGAEPASLPWAV
jgi:quercetin dioxygenase-like cupin family protein